MNHNKAIINDVVCTIIGKIKNSAIKGPIGHTANHVTNNKMNVINAINIVVTAIEAGITIVNTHPARATTNINFHDLINKIIV